jgi:hypothetical protein
MEIDDILNARNAAAADAQLRQQQMNSVTNMDNNTTYAMNSQAAAGTHQQQGLPQSQNMMNYPALTQAPQNTQMMQNDLLDGSAHEDQAQQQDANGSRPQSEAAKAFACSTCAKGFARRSDLARHGQYIQ